MTRGPFIIIVDSADGWIVDTEEERAGADGPLAQFCYHDDALQFVAAEEFRAALEQIATLPLDDAPCRDHAMRDIARKALLKVH